MHLYPRRRNVAAQVGKELKTVTYAAPSMEERRKKERNMLVYDRVLSLEGRLPLTLWLGVLVKYGQVHEEGEITLQQIGGIDACCLGRTVQLQHTEREPSKATGT